MALVQTSAPGVEPVTAADAKAFMRIDSTSEDVLIGSLVLTSRLHVEAALGLSLVRQGWRLSLDDWPQDGVVTVPVRPLLGVTNITVSDAAGVKVAVPVSAYEVDRASVPPRIVKAPGAIWPVPGRRSGGIEIDLDCGFGAGAADVPPDIRQALLMLVAHWYEHRDPVEIGSAEARIPAVVSGLLAPYVEKRL